MLSSVADAGRQERNKEVCCAVSINAFSVRMESHSQYSRLLVASSLVLLCDLPLSYVQRGHLDHGICPEYFGGKDHSQQVFHV